MKSAKIINLFSYKYFKLFQIPPPKQPQGPRNEFHLGVAYSNEDFEKFDFQKILLSKLRNLGVARATPATPVP